jgi:hypothetical protein
MQAHQICKDRLTKIQETLGQYFEKDEPGGGVTKRVMPAEPSSDGEEEEDVRF